MKLLTSASTWEIFNKHPRASEIAEGLKIIPSSWQLTPVREKRPYRKEWQHEEPVSREAIATYITQGQELISKKGNPYTAFDSGYGVRLGEVSGGLLAIDVDGKSAEPILKGICPELPKSISWSSGKAGRYQVAFQIPPEYREKLALFTRAVVREWEDYKCDDNELLEFRYNYSQSVLPPSYHPDTGRYDWINSPEDTEVAIAPQPILDLLVELADKERLATKEVEEKKAERARYLEQRKAQRQNHPSLSTADSLADILELDILPRLDTEDIYNWNGHNFKRHGKKLVGYCPQHGGSSGTAFQVNPTDNSWYCHGCQEGGHAVQYRHFVNGGHDTPKGKDFVEIVKELADDAGVRLPEWEPPERKKEIDIPISREQWEEKYGRKNNVVGFGRKNKQHKTLPDYLVEKIQKKLNSCSLTPDILLNCDTPPDDLYDKIPLEAITLLEAYKGWGKSQKVIRKLTDKLRKLGYSVLFLCPRIILGLEMAEKMMATYQDDLPQTAEALKKYNAAVVIYDSLWKFINKNWDYIIMDEARAGLKHLTTANTAVKDRRPLILSRLKEIIKNAKGILLADADPTDTEVEYIQKLAPEKQTFYIKNEALPPSREIELIIGGKKDRESVINQLHYDAEKLNDDLCTAISVVKFEHPGLAEGSEHFKRLVWDKLQEIGAEPLLITADSQIELQGIVEAIIKKFPLLGEYVIRLDRTTTEEPWAKELIKNLDGGFKAQCTLVWGWSPSLMVGVSQQMEWFKKGYCFYFGTIEPCEFRQQMLRSRPCKKWVGWAATHNNLKSGISSSFDPDERKQTYIKNYQDTTSNQSLMHLALDLAMEEARKEEREMSPEETWEYIGNFNKENYLDNPHIDLTAKIEARSDYLRFNCGENLKHELETKENFVVRPFKEGSSSDLPGFTGEEKEAIKLVKAELMYQGSLMSEDDALAVTDSKLDNDQTKLAGYKIAKGLPGTNISTDFFLEYVVKDRHWRQKQFLHFLVTHPSIAFILEARAIANHTYKWIFGESFLPDLKLNLRKGELLQEIGFIKDRKLTLAGASYNKDSQTVIDIFTKAKKFEQQIKRLFNLSVGEEPIKFIGALLDKLGKSHRSKRGTDNIRNYEIVTLLKIEATIKSIIGDDEKSITKLEKLTELKQNLLYQEAIQQSLIQRYWDDMAIEEKPIYGVFEYTTASECSTENSPPHQAYLYKDNRGDVEVTKTIGNNELEVCGGSKVKQQKNEQKSMPPHELDNTKIATLPETPDLLTEDFNEEHKFIGIGRLLSYFSPTGEVIGRYLGKIKNSVDEILVEFGGGVREIVSPRYCLAVKAAPEQIPF
ncbi:MAG: bifunctional DNA primase/polymerase [Microcoleaceae cyanobacterium MO_207.B10]|nr:bifunctional DNA primase/polymerase [Microcoleaceae cyanobacterium MO_207.B10]